MNARANVRVDQCNEARSGGCASETAESVERCYLVALRQLVGSATMMITRLTE
jgi:hypothetical protein